MKNAITSLIFCFFISFLAHSQKKVALYWDASYSMVDKDVDRELNYLNNYFKKYKEVDIYLKVFSNVISYKQFYKVRIGNWEVLKKDLKNTIYDGATSYENFFNDKVDEFLLFSDGEYNLNILEPPLNKPIHIVTSVASENARILKLMADLSEGSYVVLNNSLLSNKDIIQVKKEFILDEISGIVSDENGPLPYANVTNKNKGVVIAANEKGEYVIPANVGDILSYTAQSKKKVTIRVEKTNLIDIFMLNIKESLDEVVVNAKVEKEKLVNTGNGFVDKKRLGYDVQSISSDAISDLDTDLGKAVYGQFANLKIQISNESGLSGSPGSGSELSQFLGRGNNMTILGNQYGLVVVDGVPLAGSNSSPAQGGVPQDTFVAPVNNMLDPSMIHSITYLKGLAATNKYGTIGANGVILITTKNAVLEGDPTEITRKEGTTSTYSGNAKTLDALPNTPYIMAIKKSQTVDDAFNTYLELRKQHKDNPHFFFDMFDYFKGWGNPMISNRIVSNVLEINKKDSDVLRALSYKYQSIGNFKNALKVLRQVAKIAPKQSQSLRDLALGYVDIKSIEEANLIYGKINRNKENVNYRGISTSISSEKARAKNKNSTLVNVDNKGAKTRLVFQWNIFDAEFDLNIINPKKRYFTWSHTYTESPQRLIDEKNQGFGMEEFYIDESDKGLWTFNIKYYGNKIKGNPPTYLKVTTYKNFGLPNETTQVKVIRLDAKDVEQIATQIQI